MREQSQKHFDTFISRFFELVEQKTGFSRKLIRSKSRQQRLVYIRQSIGNILYENTDISLTETGRVLNRNHASVISGMKPKNSKSFDKKYTAAYNELSRLFFSLMESLFSGGDSFMWRKGIVKDSIYSPFVCKRFYIHSDSGTASKIEVRKLKSRIQIKPADIILRNARKQSGRNIFNKIRSENMLKEYAAGATTRELGQKYNLTVDRIRQILSVNKKAYRQIKKQKAEKEWKECLEQFMEYTKKTGKIPALDEVVLHNLLYKRHLYQRLKTHAIKQGYETNFKQKKEARHVRKSEPLLAYLRETAIRLGHTPASNDIRADAIYSPASYRYYFGSLRNAQQLAGLVPNKQGGIMKNKIVTGHK